MNFFCIQIQNYCQAKGLCFETNVNLKSLSKCTGSKYYITGPPWLSRLYQNPTPFILVCLYTLTQ